MTKTVFKWLWVWNFNDEERWLNEMAAQGLAFESVFILIYTFSRCEPGQYTYRLELLEDSVSSAKSQEYIAFLRETGVEYVNNWLRWAYFRKETYGESFVLFSDNTSKIAHIERLQRMIIPIGILNLFCGINIFYNPLAWLNLALGILFIFGIVTLHKLKKALQKNMDIYE